MYCESCKLYREGEIVCPMCSTRLISNEEKAKREAYVSKQPGMSTAGKIGTVIGCLALASGIFAAMLIGSIMSQLHHF